MLAIRIEKTFKKDIVQAKKSGKFSKKDWALFQYVISELQQQNTIDPQYKRHALKGKLKDFESIHLKFDWILIFSITEQYLNLVMLGSHTQVYQKF